MEEESMVTIQGKSGYATEPICVQVINGDYGKFFSPPQDIVLNHSRSVCVHTVYEYFRTTLKPYLKE
jgi:hypothetical protein